MIQDDPESILLQVSLQFVQAPVEVLHEMMHLCDEGSQGGSGFAKQPRIRIEQVVAVLQGR